MIPFVLVFMGPAIMAVYTLAWRYRPKDRELFTALSVALLLLAATILCAWFVVDVMPLGQP